MGFLFPHNMLYYGEIIVDAPLTVQGLEIY
jgi:hypothetical protein